MTAIHEQLRQVREDLGWTRRHLADLIGVNGSLIGRWESGANEPGLARALRWAEVLGYRLELAPGDGAAPRPGNATDRAVLSQQDRADRRARREAAGVSQGAVAALLGVNRVTVLHWESGRSAPTVRDVGRWDAALSDLAAGGAA